MGLLILIIVIIFVIAIAQIAHTSNKKKEMKDELESLDEFSHSQLIMGNDGNAGLAIDEKRKKVCLIKRNHGNVELYVITYRDILSSEIFEDGKTITKSSRGSQLGGVIIGGIALGGIGAIIGGLSGKKVSSDKVSRIDLRIIVNSTANPIHDINFMNLDSKKQGFIYTSAMTQARHWHGLIAVLIKRADTEDTNNESKLATTEFHNCPNKSVADELLKLGELKKQGLLSHAEFMVQKTKLLS